MIRASVIVASLSIAFPAVAQDTPADLAIKARAILSKHCGECHGEKPLRSSMSVMHHSRLTRNDGVVRFVTPKDVKASQLLDLIDEGSMPPGNKTKVSADDLNILRQWVQTGAPGYPAQFDDDFAHRSILSDIERRPAVDRPFMRYFSIHHLYESDPADFAKARKKVLDGLQRLFREKSPLPEPIEDTASLFRIDLRTSGWQHTPFNLLGKDATPNGPKVTASIFDAMLLEYPYAVIPEKSEEFDRLVDVFLYPAQLSGQILPIAFVRGDWFVELAGSRDMGNDLKLMFTRAKELVPPGIGGTSAMSPPKFGNVKGTLLPALDSWLGPDPVNPLAIRGLELATLEEKVDKPRSVFYPKDKFRFRYSAREPIHAQFLYLDNTNRVFKPTPVNAIPQDKVVTEILPSEDEGLTEDTGPEKLRVYAARDPFPKGETWSMVQNGTYVERFVHPFFRVEKRTVGPGYAIEMSAMKITRKSVQTEVKKRVKDD